MKPLNLYKYLFTLLLIGLMGCSRPVREDTSQFILQLPSTKLLSQKGVSLQASRGSLRHLQISVSGGGIVPSVGVKFDADKGYSIGGPTLPTFFSVEVPAGSARLIQVFAVYADASESAEVYYGDLTADLPAGDVYLSVPISIVGSGNINGSRIAGRYFTQNGVTPSGTIEARYQPPNGKPPIVIEKDSMISGWFKVFALDTFPLDYVLVPGNTLLFSQFKLDGLTFNDNKKMRIMIPKSTRKWGGGNAETRNSENVVMGFFGPGVPAATKVCYTSANHEYTNIFRDSNLQSKMMWSATATPGDVNYITAQKSSQIGTCVATDIPFETALVFKPSLYNNWSSLEAMHGFVGAFQLSPSTANGGVEPIPVKFDSSGKYFASFSVLPGIAALAETVEIFYRANRSPEDYRNVDDASSCKEITKFGFRPIGKVDLVAGKTTYLVNENAPSDISNNAVMAFCPMRSKLALGGGYISSSIQNTTNTGPSPVSANSFESYLRYYQLGTGQCHQVEIRLLRTDGSNNNNYNVTNSSEVIVAITNNNQSSGAKYYNSEADCLANSSNNINSVTVAPDTVHRVAWLRTPNTAPPGGANEVFTVAGAIAGINVERTVHYNFSVVGTSSSLRNWTTQIKMMTSQCFPIEVYLTDSAGFTKVATSDFLISLGKYALSNPGMAISDSSFDFYTDCSSTTPVNEITFNSGSYRASFAVRTSATSIPADRIVRGSSAPFGSFEFFLNVNSVAHMLKLDFFNFQNIYEGTCVSAGVSAVDSSGQNQVTSTPIPFNLFLQNSTQGLFAGGFVSSCAQQSFQNTFNLPAMAAGMGPMPIFFRAENASSGLQAKLNSVLVTSESMKNFNILPVPALSRTSVKLHLTSDVLPSDQATVMWPNPQFTNRPFLELGVADAVQSNADPTTNGFTFNNVSPQALMGGFDPSYMPRADDDFAITIKFKVAADLSSGSTAYLIKLNDNQTALIKIYMQKAGNDISLKGFLIGSVYPANIEFGLVTVGTWYTATLALKKTPGQPRLYSYLNSAGSQTVTNSMDVTGGFVGNYGNNFTVGTGFAGAIKAIIVDSATSLGGDQGFVENFIINQDKSYLDNRVP